ncbi:hypothetical protein [Nocardia abscessus]|uniref:hypothetical protein n=1 Tax=Nocardia abscessus TaxID=120957 RepID=UPI0024574CF7|nr:hypothetical protein [Nocardia abscessus]
MPLVTVDEVAQGWRPLDAGERSDAEGLIVAAEAWIRDPSRRPDIADDDPIGKRVVIEVVRTALGPAGGWHNHTAYTDTMGPFAQSGTLVTPAGTLQFTEWHAQLLGISVRPMPRYYFGDCGPAGRIGAP